SKLRSSIGGVYNWRVMNTPPGPVRDKMVKEAEFAFKQSFAFCPYSPEAVFRYINLLLSLAPGNPARLEDALLIAETCKTLDPGNGQVDDLISKLRDMKKGSVAAAQAQAQLGTFETQFRSNPSVPNAFSLAQIY